MRRLKIVGLITIRSMAIGLMSGSAMGAFSALGEAVLILTYGKITESLYRIGSSVMLGAAFGVVLGMVGGLLLGVATAAFFYPLGQARLYRAIAPIIGAVIAGCGAAIWGPLAFSSTSMTPLSAVTIGLGSVLVSLIAGWAGVLAAQNMVQWYEHWEFEHTQAEAWLAEAVLGTVESAATSPEVERPSKPALIAIAPGWIGVALLAFIGSPAGYLPLRWLVCGTADVRAVFTCLPSPRLYTSVSAGFKATLPIILVIVLAFLLLKKLFKQHRH